MYNKINNKKIYKIINKNIILNIYRYIGITKYII